ncbi:MAG: hypothetical protein MK132_08195 [Lentisphaerales bacterium]|nr:hypothetical protein [Lentisphaerales bacterium]
MSDAGFQLGKFKFRSTSSNVEVFFQDEISQNEDSPVEEEANHSQEEIDAAYEQGVQETQASLQPQIEALQAENAQIKSQFDPRLNQLTESFQRSFNELEVQFINEVCNMSMKLAERIIRRECVKKEQLVDLIKSSIKDIFTDSNITLKLHAEDLSYVAERINSSKITCEECMNITPGGAIIDYKQGFIDLTLDSRLQVLKDHFDSVKEGGGVAE